MKYLITLLLIFFLGFTFSTSSNQQELIDYLKRNAFHISTPSDLDPMLERVGNARYVLLGEASHGTSEYYIWRAKISKRLIEEKNFSFIAVEGDWTSAFEVNKYIKNLPGAANTVYEVLENFDRWPQWMWANEETAELIEWLREYNKNLPLEDKVGFYGIDLYAMWESIEAVKEYFLSEFPHKKHIAQYLYECFLPFSDNLQQYAIAVYQRLGDCRDEITQVINAIEHLGEEATVKESIDYFTAKQNAKVIKNAEEHYRNMVYRGPAGWNARVFHFKRTVENVRNFYGDDAKGIIWAHNTHVGDARATPMPEAGMYNIGQLLREKHGESEIFIVGFGTHRGSVIAGREWGAPMEIMTVPTAIDGSIEDIFYRFELRDFVLLLDEDDVPDFLLSSRGHRAKGVVYRPENEAGNYVPTILSRRYNAFIFLEQTNALTPIN